MITGWFDVSKEGLANLLERRGRAFAILELLQNAWDTRCTRVDVALEPLPNRAEVMVRVTDDDPEGFANLAHAYTLFAPSVKGGDAEKRGRFNLGEKLVLACCRKAMITTTTGRVTFEGKTRTLSRHRRTVGSEFLGYLTMTRDQFTEALAMVRMALPPDHVPTFINGIALAARSPIATIKRSLPTEIADAEGRLRRTARVTEIRVFEPLAGEAAHLYELGIPVVALADDRFHIDVRQKVPLPFDRDSVTPAYLASVRAAALDAAVTRLTPEETSTRWVTDAMEHADTDTVVAAVRKRFGDKLAAFDPSDLEANNRVVSMGYTVVPGASLPKAAWAKLREAGAALAAGKIAPTHPEKMADAETVPPSQWTVGQRRVARWASYLARTLLNVEIEVRIIRSLRSDVVASWGRLHLRGALLTFNVSRLGHDFFDVVPDLPTDPAWVKVNDLLLHEMAHHAEANHLSDAYHDAICNLGAKLFALAVNNPQIMACVREDDADAA
jgi:hypothetical protein